MDVHTLMNTCMHTHICARLLDAHEGEAGSLAAVFLLLLLVLSPPPAFSSLQSVTI